MPESVDIIRAAIEIFVQGYCFGRSLTYPHIASQVEGLWWLRDAERPNPRDYRKEEWVAFDVSAEEVDRVAKLYSRGRYVVCAASRELQLDAVLRDQYKRLGYRLLTTEPMFVHALKRIPRVGPSESGNAHGVESDCSIARICLVDTCELAERFAKASRSRVLVAEQIIATAPFRQYVALFEEAIVGWVRSVTVGNCTWVANMHVDENLRRRGIGSSLLERLLRDDRKLGVRQSVLLATRAGAKLYPKLGYRQIGTMYIFAPRG